MELRDAFASEVIGQTVQLRTGTQRFRIGKVEDIAVSGGESFPPVVGLYVKGIDGVTRYAPFASIASFDDKAVALSKAPVDMNQATLAGDQLLLSKQLLDKQIVDVDGRKVVRVNDVKLAPAGEHLRVIAADVGLPGLLRRLGLRSFSQQLAKKPSPSGVRSSLISWDAVQPLHHDMPGDAIRLRVSQDRIDRIHPADLAAIIEDLAAGDQASLIGSLDEATAADALEQLDVDTQLSILEDLQPDRAADIIENMTPDDAADLLGEIDRDKQQEILALMQPDEARDVRELLSHSETTAGGLMTTEYLWLPPNLTVAQAFEHIRSAAKDAELVYYIYVLDPQENILGVVSLRDLVTAQPEASVVDIAVDDVVTVDLHASSEDVASLIARYDFVAVPVVDEQGRMHGIVTVDDVIDVLLPEKLRKSFPRVGKSRSRSNLG
ncbi:MAG: magnesium transporter [Candidatus Eremiobacter antarcticus]|nr:magnesium transporter [Candidatus Eremiobacteraeota bacterium]MBC5807363.1 magnesium transporter [Candidatus Eremiobacteraeota bacterium]PZR63116.1 MAG: magnesium transporter [Candidatus Eremiobacter sp. RRmetagenome_bin22]